MDIKELRKSFDDVPKISQQDERINKLIKKVFYHDADGKELLKLLIDKFLLFSVCPPDKPISYGYFREGQNQLLLNIKKIADNWISKEERK